MFAIFGIEKNIKVLQNHESYCYNCQGLGAGKCEYIMKLCKTCNFILLQEHWLHDGDTLLSRELPDIRYHLVSGMDSSAVHVGQAIWRMLYPMEG